MEEFWNHGGRPPYTSVQTTVYRLEEKGALRRVRKIGNAHIFESALTREEATEGFIGQTNARRHSRRRKTHR
jgi:BlaI family penicillinase repressor